MNIQLLSDLHLEFSDRHPPFQPPATDAEVIVLAGDIDNGTRAIDWAERTFAGRTVLYVPGNHEYYDGELATVAAGLRARAARSPNVKLLDNDEAVIGGVRFLGSTLWTDFELFGADTIAAAIAESLRYVVDFRAIRNGNTLFTPEHSVTLHRQALEFLESRLAAPFSGNTVVITHHAPHAGSVHPRWAAQLSSAAFVSNLDRLLGKAQLWLHGHTHDSFDYTAAGCRVVANPMGYRTSNWSESRDGAVPVRLSFENPRFDPDLTLSI